MRILYVVNIIQAGGAEMQLLNLSRELLKTKNLSLKIISLKAKGDLSYDFLSEISEHITYLDFRPSCFAASLKQLYKEINYFDPDIIHSWMYHSNFIITLITGFTKYKNRVIWSVHHNDLSYHNNKISTLLVIKFLVLFSFIFKPKIVYVSEKSKIKHNLFGFRSSDSLVISNAIDLSFFKFKKNAKQNLVDSLYLPNNSILIGYIARFDKIKNHKGFLDGIKLLLTNPGMESVFVIMSGLNITDSNEELIDLIEKAGLSAKVKLLGVYFDMPFIYSAIDVCVLMSFNESFSLVLVESLACGTLCVSSKESDPLNVIDKEYILEHNNAITLNNKISNIITNNLFDYVNREKRREKTLAFDIHKQIENYLSLYFSVNGKDENIIYNN
jgi:glycosyltransferase involved in cell wall biosynthesis